MISSSPSTSYHVYSRRNIMTERFSSLSSTCGVSTNEKQEKIEKRWSLLFQVNLQRVIMLQKSFHLQLIHTSLCHIFISLFINMSSIRRCCAFRIKIIKFFGSLEMLELNHNAWSDLLLFCMCSFVFPGSDFNSAKFGSNVKKQYNSFHRSSIVSNYVQSMIGVTCSWHAPK